MKLSAFEVNPARVDDGAWVKSIPGAPGLRLLVRGINSLACEKARARVRAEIYLEKRGNLDDADLRRIEDAALAEALLGWEGLEDDDGTPIPYSRDLAVSLTGDRRYMEMREAVDFAARIVGRASADFVEDAAKN